MNTRTGIRGLLVVLAIIAAPAGVVLGQVAGPTTPSETPGDADTRPITEDELDALLNSLTPEQLQELIKVAMVQRLTQERLQAIAEIKQGLLYAPEDIEAAGKILKTKPANTQRDNIDRICKAFAKVDPRFARLWRLLEKKDYKAAAATAEKLIDPERATYLSAATYYVFARALIAAGEAEDGVEVYREILINMPDRISFASSAAMAAAQTYEEIGRLRYAMEMYAYALNNYALTLSKEDSEKVLKKIEKYGKIYDDPLGTVATKMGYVQTRLAAVDSGKNTQQKEKEILALLEDLIKTAEEKQKSGGGSPKPKPGKKPGDGKPGQKPPSLAGGPPTGNNPSSPAKVSMLVPGKTARPPKDSTTHDAKGDSDWATLPPREQEKIRQAIRKVMSERYKDITGEYHTALTKSTSE